MRVMLLVESLTVGGLPNHVLDLARALTAAGDQVAVAHGGAEVPGHLDVQGVHLLPLPRRERAAVLQAWQPDVVHVHLGSDPALLHDLQALPVPRLRSFHDYTSLCLRRGRRRWPGDRCQRALGHGCLLQGCTLGPPAAGSRLPSWQDLPAKLAERSHYQGFDAAIVGSRYMQRTLVLNGFADERVHWIPYFSRFDAEARGERPLGPKPSGVPGRDRPLQLLFAGQAVAGKGLRVLVRALGALPPGLDWTLTAVSDGPELPPARQLAARLGIAGRIDFKGWLPQPELLSVYRAADLLVVPSVWDDPGPLVGIEALALGTAVLGFPVGGIPDYTLDGDCGFLAPAVSVAALARTLARAFEAAPQLAAMGERGRALVARQHARSRHVELLRGLYARTAAAPRPARPLPRLVPA